LYLPEIYEKWGEGILLVSYFLLMYAVIIIIETNTKE